MNIKEIKILRVGSLGERTDSEAQGNIYTMIISPEIETVKRMERAIAKLDSMTAELRRGCENDSRLKTVLFEMHREADEAYMKSLLSNGERTEELHTRRATLEELICRAALEGAEDGRRKHE